MSREVQRVGIVGAGFGERFARAFHDDPRAELVAVCTRTPGSAARIVAATGGRAYTDVDTMLERESPGVVVVAAPNNLHHPMTISALTAGADVICEKPLALNVDQAGEMALTARRLARRTCTSFTWRFLPGCVALKRLVERGDLGVIYHADIRYVTRGFGAIDGPMRWQHDHDQAGSGAAANLGSHAIDLVHWWLGGVRRVSAVTRTVIPARMTASGRIGRVSVDDVCSALYVLEDGTPVSLSVGWVAHVARVELDVVLHASRGSARLRYAPDDSSTRSGLLTYTDGVRRSRRLSPTAEQSTADWTDLGQACVTRLAGSFLDTLAGAESGMPDFDDGLRAQCVLDATLAASNGGGWVDVAYAPGAAADERHGSKHDGETLQP